MLAESHVCSMSAMITHIWMILGLQVGTDSIHGSVGQNVAYRTSNHNYHGLTGLENLFNGLM